MERNARQHPFAVLLQVIQKLEKKELEISSLPFAPTGIEPSSTKALCLSEVRAMESKVPHFPAAESTVFCTSGEIVLTLKQLV